MSRVVITGLGVLASNGHGLQAFAGALRAGRSGIRFHPELAQLGFACQVAGIPENLDDLGNRYFDRVRLRGMDRHAVIGCIAGLDAWDDAGLECDCNSEVDWNTGVSFGSGVGGVETVGKTLVPLTDSGQVRRLGSTIPERIMGSAVSARLAGFLGAGGPTSSNSSACSTGTEAIINGYRWIREGLASIVLTGASEGDSPYIWAGFDAMQILSRKFNATPAGASRPLSNTACGFVPAAGSGALVLESLDRAIGRGARIYAEILGAAANCGGQRNGGSMTAANADAVRRCIQTAVCRAGISASEIGLISGHLTATTADAAEMENWRAALDLPSEAFPWVNAPKSMLGHGLGAAGAIESVACVLQLHHGFVHPSINCEDLHPAVGWCAPRVPSTAIDMDLRIAAKASFGFGDVNTCLILRKWESA